MLLHSMPAKPTPGKDVLLTALRGVNVATVTAHTPWAVMISNPPASKPEEAHVKRRHPRRVLPQQKAPTGFLIRQPQPTLHPPCAHKCRPASLLVIRTRPLTTFLLSLRMFPLTTRIGERSPGGSGIQEQVFIRAVTAGYSREFNEHTFL